MNLYTMVTCRTHTIQTVLERTFAWHNNSYRIPVRMASSKIKTADRIEEHDTNLWVEYAALVAAEHNVVNLGKGFPDFSPPQFLIDALVDSTKHTQFHQYTRGPGHVRLVKALGSLYSKVCQREINPMTEVTTTVGAYSALHQAVQGHVNPGDEVIIIEPFFDCYRPMTLIAGGKLVYVPLRPSPNADKGNGRYPISSKGWTFDPEELENAFTNKTKMLIINNPNNPLGKVFSRAELQMVADLCIKYDVLCISDEVYEWLVYPGSELVKIATLPNMWERTITIDSAGKAFSCTGWKTGWAIGPDNLIKNCVSVGTNTYHAIPSALQEAIAIACEKELEKFGQPDSYFKELPALLLKKRDKTVEVLREIGMNPVVPEGGYVILSDTDSLGISFQSNGEEPYDRQFVKWMVTDKKLAAVPSSYFFCPEHQKIADKVIRFCFSKEESTLEAAYEKLRSLNN